MGDNRGGAFDAQSLRSEIEIVHGAAFAWAVRCCGGNSDYASDVLHNAYGKILSGRAVFRGGSAFKTWLFAVIRNTAAEERRRKWMRQILLAGYTRERRDEIAAPHCGLEQFERAERVRKALASLPKRQAEVLHLVFHEDLTIEASASIMGISIGSARTHYERGKRRLRELLKDSK